MLNSPCAASICACALCARSRPWANQWPPYSCSSPPRPWTTWRPLPAPYVASTPSPVSLPLPHRRPNAWHPPTYPPTNPLL
ncbi:hypothetical protein DL240_07010 [Lujinxingia litoralis]|uniref:Uncharacterized protein n=1 Tax=Lujinxingia litoralis TaxID=2211119 RepID=A0A328CD43_9DELT|nr:hypothetical protein DL240_07010 [Lujinxingia litoralis]